MNGIVSSSTSALAVGCGTRDCPILFQYIVRKWICRCSCIICSSSPLFGEPFSVCLCEINIFFSLCDQVILHQNLEITVTRTCCEHLQSVVHKEVSLIFVINWITSRLSVSIVFVFTRKKKREIITNPADDKLAPKLLNCGFDSIIIVVRVRMRVRAYTCS